MNAEERAKAYDEALTRARELYNAAKVYDFTDDMKRLEYVFPELCENPQQVLMVASSINHAQDINENKNENDETKNGLGERAG